MQHVMIHQMRLSVVVVALGTFPQNFALLIECKKKVLITQTLRFPETVENQQRGVPGAGLDCQ